MDENQFRAEIAEIFREQDRRFERAQKRMDRMEAASEKRLAASEKRLATSEKRLVASERRLERIEILQDQNAKAISSLQKVVTDFMDIYQFREQSADQKYDSLNTRLQALEKGPK